MHLGGEDGARARLLRPPAVAHTCHPLPPHTTIIRAGGEVKHIRVTNTKDGGYSLGKSKDEFSSIWDLIEAQLDKRLKSTKGADAVELMCVYPPPCLLPLCL